MREKQMWQLCPVFFAQSPNLVETWKIFHSNYFVLKMFHLRGWKLTWQPCHFRLNLRKSFTYCVETTKKVWFSPKNTTFYHCFTFHWTRKGILTILPNVFAQILKQIPYIKVFKELLYPRRFSGRVKALLTGTPKPLFDKSYIKSLHNVRKGWVISTISMKCFFLNLFFCTHRIQFWNNWRKHLAKVVTKTLLKIREWKQKTGFPKKIAENVLLDI